MMNTIDSSRSLSQSTGFSAPEPSPPNDNARLTTTQILSADRIYQIETAVRHSLRDALPKTYTEKYATRPRFHFIASSWRHAEALQPYFQFTYFTVTRFDDKVPQIVAAIRQQPCAWESLLLAAESGRPPGLQRTSDFLRRIISANDSHPDLQPDPAELHYHFATLSAAIPVSGVIPGALWNYHANRTSTSPAAPSAYIVNTVPDPQKPASLPRLQIQPIFPQFSLQSFSPVPQSPPTQLPREARHAYVELTLWLTDPTKEHAPSTPPIQVSRDQSNSTTIWLPVHEDYQDRRFFGRFLGWLFQSIDNPSTTRDFQNDKFQEHVKHCLSISNQFAKTLVAIDSQALLAFLLTSPPPKGQRQPARFLADTLARWEGWASVKETRPTTPGPHRWWHIERDTLELSLHPARNEDRRLWGDFSDKDLNSLSLRRHASSIPWPKDKDFPSPGFHFVLGQVRRLRELARQVACALRDIGTVEYREAAVQHGNWTHEVKNSAITTANLLLPDIRRTPRIRLAYYTTQTLAATAFVAQQLAPGGAGILCTPDTAVLRSSLEFLLYLRALELGLESPTGPRLAYSDASEARSTNTKELDPAFLESLKTRTPRVTCALALLREVVGNIRNENPAFGEPDIVVTYSVTGNETAIVDICQRQYESCRPASAHSDKKTGIDRTNELFRKIGKITPNAFTVQADPDKGFLVTRQYRVEWKGE